MDFLKRHLTGRHSGYVRLESEGSGESKKKTGPKEGSGLFGSRKVASTKSAQEYSLKSVAEDMSLKYGETIQKKVMSRKCKGNISQKKSESLYQKAEKKRQSFHKKNHAHLQQWLSLDRSSTLLAKSLTKSCPTVKPGNLSSLERTKLTNFMMEKFQATDRIIKKEEVSAACEMYLKQYESAFSSSVPALSCLVQEQFCDEPLLQEHFQIWADTMVSGQSGQAARFLNRFIDVTQKNNQLIQTSPYEMRAEHSFSRQLVMTRSSLDQLERMERQLEHTTGKVPETLKKALLSDLNVQKKQVKEHMKYLVELKKQDYCSGKNAVMVAGIHMDTALNILDRLIEKAEKEKASPEGSVSNDRRIDSLKKQKKQILRRKNNLRPSFLGSNGNIAEFSANHKKSIKKLLKQGGVTSSEVKKLWPSSSLQAANNAKWQPVDKTVTVRNDGVFHQYRSTITPASALRFYPDKTSVENDQQRALFENDYKGGACASPTKDRTDHALNLHQTKLMSEPNSPESKTLFAGIRTGTIAAQKITDPEKRKEAGLNWAKEIITAALLQKMEQEPATVDKVVNNEKVPLRLASTSLLTPDWLRHITHINDDELTLQKEQYQALHTLASSGEPLVIHDASGQRYEVDIDLEVVTLNVGVNAISLNPVISGVANSWQQADQYTKEGLDTLLGSANPQAELGGWTGEWISKHPDHPSKETVIELSRQIKQIFNTDSHHSQGQDAYKLMTRLQMLSFMIGAVPHFNCKSGKDRTGEADASVKALASTIEQQQSVPEPDGYWSTERKELQQAMMYGAGEEEVLMYNTGDPRFKTGTGKDHQGKLFDLLHL